MFKGGTPVPSVLLVNKVDLLTDAEESFRIGAQFEKVFAWAVSYAQRFL